VAQLDEVEERANGDLLAAAPGLVRLAATAYLRTLGWTVTMSLRTANGALRLVLTGEEADALVNSLGRHVRDQLKRLLGVTEIEARLERLPEPPDPEARRNGRPADYRLLLKQRGSELLARSADVEDDPVHPAYERILTSLAPDEARILRLMATEGARAAVDVRSRRPLGAGSSLVESALTMIGHDAGCRHIDRVPAYLNNLQRLGLIWFSDDALEDLSAYQVLEAQAKVVEAMQKAGRGKTMRRAVHMTPLGCDFCDACLPIDAVDLLVLEDEVAADGDS